VNQEWMILPDLTSLPDLTLLVGQQEGHPACNKVCSKLIMPSLFIEVLTKCGIIFS